MAKAKKPVLVKKDMRGVATVTLNRPEKNNAYDAEMIRLLIKGAGKLAADPDVRVILIRAKGRHFQAGADLGWLQSVRKASVEENIAVSDRTTAAVHGLTAMPKPVIALVQGGCFGGGTGLISACDIVIAERSALFAITEARWGLIATPIVPQLLSRIGPGRLRRYALSCERFDAPRAMEIGLVDEICEEGGLDAVAAPIIDALLRCPPGALSATKEALLKYAGLAFSDLEKAEMARPHAMTRLGAEAEEGLSSFIEKRNPAWYPG